MLRLFEWIYSANSIDLWPIFEGKVTERGFKCILGRHRFPYQALSTIVLTDICNINIDNIKDEN